MYETKINEEEKENYDLIKIDDKTFYKKKIEPNKNKANISKRVKRYSDQFKNPSYEKKNQLRQLKILRKFKNDFNNLDVLIDKWRSTIDQCIIVLQKEFGIPANLIFKGFSLEKHKFDYQDYCNNSDLEEETEKNELWD